MDKIIKVAVLGIAGLVTYKIGKRRGMNILMKRVKEIANEVRQERNIIINEKDDIVCQ